VAQPDAFTLAAELKASYDQLSADRDRTKDQPVTVAIVPAMIPVPQNGAPEETGRTSGDYFQILKTVRTAIKNELHQRQDLPATAPGLVFYTPARPVTIYPGNADRVIGQLCPTADFSIILLGKNVYRAVFIDPEADIYPHKRWLYLDVDDVRYGQADVEIETVVRAILPVIAARSLPPSES
jgi:hypothetical protein